MEDFERLLRGTTLVVPEEELKKKIELGKKLRIKFGIDPTSSKLHLGHAVIFAKLRELQELGAEVIFLIGDFTAKIGDPTGRSKTRVPLTDDEISLNFETYCDQIRGLIDVDKITVRRNSEWFSKLGAKDWIDLCSRVTVSQIIEREDFANRMGKKQPIGLHELLYPLLQAYDSVVLEPDVEIGGNDQMFNLYMARDLQERFGQESQVIMTLPLLPGLDGFEKMSKSLGNTIELDEPADKAYGKLMSISDDLMWDYYGILLCYTKEEILEMREKVVSGDEHPMDLKKKLAAQVIEKFWGAGKSVDAQRVFEDLFQKKDFESAEKVSIDIFGGESIWVVDFLKKLGVVKSSNEATRMLKSGALTIDGEKVLDFKSEVKPKSGMQIKFGKHQFFKLV